MIKGKEPQIIRMNCATVIYTQDAFFIYDKAAGDKMESILCIASKSIPEDFIKEIEATKVVKIEKVCPPVKDGCFSFSVILSPQFGYSNQMMESIVYQFFEKYKL